MNDISYSSSPASSLFSPSLTLGFPWPERRSARTHSFLARLFVIGGRKRDASRHVHIVWAKVMNIFIRPFSHPFICASDGAGERDEIGSSIRRWCAVDVNITNEREKKNAENIFCPLSLSIINAYARYFFPLSRSSSSSCTD